MQDLAGRHVVVTGGTGALGSAVVGVLLDRGALCHVTSFAESELETFPHVDHERVRIIRHVDVGEEAQVVRVYESFGSGQALWGSVHIAGGFAMSPITETGADAFDKQMRLNAKTCFLACREAVRRMREGGGGRIVNVGARPALFPELGAGMVAYAASKAAVGAITQALGAEVGPEGIWVNAVIPSIIDTPANRKAMANADHAAWPKPDEIAQTIAFLVSPGNQVTRGALVPVYGRS